MRAVNEPEPAESDTATTVSMPSLAAARAGSEGSHVDESTSELPAVAEPAIDEPQPETAELHESQSADEESVDSADTAVHEPASSEPASSESASRDSEPSEPELHESESDESELHESESHEPESDEAAAPVATTPSDTEEHADPDGSELDSAAALHAHDASDSPSGEHRAAGIASSVWLEPEEGRSRRSVLRAVSALAIAVVSAVALGLLIVVFSNAVGGGSSKKGSTPPALTLPAGPAKPPATATPADWVQQTDDQGIVFRAPPGWTERADSRIDYRVEPSPSGPGVSQVGIGLVTGGSDPNAAATSYASDTYSGQPGYVQQPATDQVSARGEQGRQVVVDYTRSGTPVDVVIRAFPTPRGVLLVVSRAAVADDQRANRLADALDASVRLP